MYAAKIPLISIVAIRKEEEKKELETHHQSESQSTLRTQHMELYTGCTAGQLYIKCVKSEVSALT